MPPAKRGSARKSVGIATGNESLEVKGRGDQAKGGLKGALKQAGEKVKDVFKK